VGNNMSTRARPNFSQDQNRKRKLSNTLVQSSRPTQRRRTEPFKDLDTRIQVQRNTDQRQLIVNNGRKVQRGSKSKTVDPPKQNNLVHKQRESQKKIFTFETKGINLVNRSLHEACNIGLHQHGKIQINEQKDEQITEEEICRIKKLSLRMERFQVPVTSAVEHPKNKNEVIESQDIKDVPDLENDDKTIEERIFQSDFSSDLSWD